jgi:hypothetical protein
MSVLMHPWVISVWSWARWVIGWVIPLIFARSVFHYARDIAHTAPVYAVLCGVVTFAVVAALESAYCQHLVPGAGLSERGSLAVAVMWTVPIDAACALVSFLPSYGLAGTATLWLACSTGLGVLTWLTRSGTVRRPDWLPSGQSLAVMAIAVSVLAAPTTGGSSGLAAIGSGLADHAVATLGVVAIAAAAVVVALLAGSPQPEGLDAAIAAVGIDTFVLGCRMVDGPHPTPGHPEQERLRQALYAPPRRFGAVRIAHVPNGTVNPATGKYEYRHLKVPASCRSVGEAVAWSYDKPPTAYAPVRRT